MDSARHALRMLKTANLADTRLIICSMEGPTWYPEIMQMLTEPEFLDSHDKVVITTEPAYLARWTSRTGGGPAIIEADTYRCFHQNGPFPGSACGYRTKEEEQEWQARDPLTTLSRELVSRGLLEDVPAADRVEMKYVDAIAGVMHRRMEQDERVVVLGEDVHRLKGGSRGATKGLVETFPDRVLGTPISEAALSGLGGGIALDGRYYPVVALMYADFIWVSADQLLNQIAKARHMCGGDHAMPLLLRIKVGSKTGYGSQPSMDPAGILATSVGFRIIAPSTSADYIGLVNTAMRLDDPVAVLEHDADLYQRRFEVPEGDLDYCLPLGKAKVRRPGDEVTVLSYTSMVERCIEAAEQEGVDADVIDLRWLDRGSLDWHTITASVKRTNRVLIVEQGSAGTSYGGWLGDEISRRLFDWLDAPVARVHGSGSSPSISKVLEAASLADVDEIVAALRELQY